MKSIELNLQLFADAGTVVNATGGYVNAYDGTTESSTSLSNLMKTFYDTELLENARAELFHAQFGRRQGLPANKGKTVEWRKWNTLPNAAALTEGVIPTGEKFGQSSQTSSIGQYGIYVTVTDQLEMHAVDNVILGATEELGASAGSTEDTLIRNTIVAGSNVLYAPKSDGTAISSRITLSSTCRLTPDLVNKAVTTLKKLKAPKIGGKYVAIIHPSVAYDLRSSDAWIEAHKYSAATELFNGEIGELHGCRFVESTEAKIWNGENLAGSTRTLTANGAVTANTTVNFDGGTVAVDALIGRYVIINGTKAKVTDNTATQLTLDTAVTCADNAIIYPGEGGAEGLAVYATLFLGKNAYGIIDPDGAGLEMIVHAKSEVGGPLDQFSTVGYKLSTASKVLYEDRLVRVESCSAFSTDDESN